MLNLKFFIDLIFSIFYQELLQHNTWKVDLILNLLMTEILALRKYKSLVTDIGR